MCIFDSMKRSLVLLFLLGSVGSLSYAQEIVYSDTLNMEQPLDYLAIEQTLGNVWQVGVPQKDYLDSAWSAPKVIMTDTTEFYPANNRSVFIIKLEQAVLGHPPVNTYFSFRHKFDTDTLADFGRVEVSYDGGDSWQLLGTDTSYDVLHQRSVPLVGSYAGIPDSAHHYSGRSPGWYQENFQWLWYLPRAADVYWPDSIWIRFVFESDSIDEEKEGWMVDDIIIRSDFYTGINDLSDTIEHRIFPVPVNDQLNVHFSVAGEYEMAVFDMSGKLLEAHAFSGERAQWSTVNYPVGRYIYRIVDVENARSSSGAFVVIRE